MTRTRSTGARQPQHLLKGPRRGRARASHWLIGRSVHRARELRRPLFRTKTSATESAPTPGARGRSGARNRLGWREARLWASARIGGARGVVAEVGATAWGDAAGLWAASPALSLRPCYGGAGNPARTE